MYNRLTGDPEKYKPEDVYFLPLILTHDTIINELNSILIKFGDGHEFISYKNAFDCSAEICRLGKLAKLVLDRDSEKGKKIIMEIIDRLCHIQTDDDDFPVSDLQFLFDILGEEKSLDEICCYYNFLTESGSTIGRQNECTEAWPPKEGENFA